MELVRSCYSTNLGLPSIVDGSAPALPVSGPAQRSRKLRPARSPGRQATLCTRGFSSLVASTAALIATGWSEPVPGWAFSHCGPSIFHGARRTSASGPAKLLTRELRSLRESYGHSENSVRLQNQQDTEGSEGVFGTNSVCDFCGPQAFRADDAGGDTVFRRSAL